MTPALKAMVEAMAAEIDGQEQRARQEGRALTEEGYLVDFDLEKVARAGLEAIKDGSDMDLIGLALRDLPGGYRPGSHSARDIWVAKIDAILKEQP